MVVFSQGERPRPAIYYNHYITLYAMSKLMNVNRLGMIGYVVRIIPSRRSATIDVRAWNKLVLVFEEEREDFFKPYQRIVLSLVGSLTISSDVFQSLRSN